MPYKLTRWWTNGHLPVQQVDIISVHNHWTWVVPTGGGAEKGVRTSQLYATREDAEAARAAMEAGR